MCGEIRIPRDMCAGNTLPGETYITVTADPILVLGCIVLYHMRILYHTRMVHTICVYAYGTTIRVWYGKSYHLSIANLVCV